MNPLLYFVAGLGLGTLVTYLLARPIITHLVSELAYHRKELATAQDRLVHAWRDEKAIIPPRPTEFKAPEALPSDLLDVVNEWESPETRASVEAQLRNLYFDKGLGVPAILKHMQNVGLET